VILRQFSGKMNTTSAPAMILPVGPVLDAPSTNICHTSSSEVILVSMTSSIMSVYSFDAFRTGWAARKSVRACRLTTFLGTKVMLYWNN